MTSKVYVLRTLQVHETRMHPTPTESNSAMQPNQRPTTSALITTSWVELGEAEGALAQTMVRLESSTTSPLGRSLIIYIGRDKTGHLWYSLRERSPPLEWENRMGFPTNHCERNKGEMDRFDPNFESTLKTPVYEPRRVWLVYAHVQSGM